MTNTEPKVLTKRKKSSQISELCRMIETCAKLGASSLRYGDLHVRFGQPAHVEPSVEVAEVRSVPLSSAPDVFSIADPDLLEDMRRSQLMMDDPYSFEQELIDQHLRQGAINETVEDRRA